MIGQTVSHYKILEPLGQGGMGVVYRAEDTRLNRHVALKFLPQGASAGLEMRARFLQEARAAAALDHPNICPVYEIGDDGAVPFIAMGYIDGRSLHEEVARGPLEIAKALDISLQIAAGLQAAHERGIVHRDIKPANILLSQTGQVRITDFGLARMADASRLTRTGTTMGTSAYCSPEQTRGEEVDHRTDIWAFGVVLYELIAGRRPFTGDAEATVVYSVLMDEPPPVSSLRDGVPPAIDRILQKALAKDSAVRYQQISELREDLVAVSRAEHMAVALHADRSSQPRKTVGRVWRWIVPAVLAASVGLAVWGAPRLVSRINPTELATPAATRRTAVVMGFGGDKAAVNEGLPDAVSETITATLSAFEGVHVVPREVVGRLELELGIAPDRPLDDETLTRVRLNAGADIVVAGVYQQTPNGRDTLRVVHVRALDARTGQELASVSDSSRGSIFDGALRASLALAGRLGFGPLPPEARAQIEASIPKGIRAGRLYAQGQRKLRAFDAPGAAEDLEALLAIDPTYSLAHLAIARAWAMMGYDLRAREAIERAVETSAGLSRENRLFVEAQRHELFGDWEKSIDAYAVLFGYFPDNIEYGLRLSEAQVSGDRPADALETIEQLRRLPPPASQDARIDLVACKAAEAVSDFASERVAAERARMKASTQGATLLLADAWYNEGWALWNLGEPAGAVAAYEEANTHFLAAGLHSRSADMLNATAIVQWDEGKLDEALALYERALGIKREAGQKGNQANILNNISNIHKSRGELETAKRVMEEAIAIRRETGQEGGLSTNLSNMGNLLKDMGDLEAAQAHYEEAIEIARRVGRKQTEAGALMNLAELKHTVGDLPGARDAHERSLRVSSGIGRKRDMAFSYWGLGRISFSEADFDRAITLYDSSITVYRDVEFEDDARVTRLWVAEALLEQGKWADAVSILEESVVFFAQGGLAYEELVAQELLLRLRLREGKPEEAKPTADRVRALARENEDFELGALASISLARLEGTLGEAEKALEALRRVSESAAGRQYFAVQLEARLAIAEIERRRGRVEVSDRLFTAVKEEATERGFLLIASRAAARRV